MKNNDLKQALIKLRDFMKRYTGLQSVGLCTESRYALMAGRLTSREYILIGRFIKENRPVEGKYFDSDYKDSGFWWRCNDKSIRLDFLTYHINKL